MEGGLLDVIGCVGEGLHGHILDLVLLLAFLVLGKDLDILRQSLSSLDSTRNAAEAWNSASLEKGERGFVLDASNLWEVPIDAGVVSSLVGVARHRYLTLVRAGSIGVKAGRFLSLSCPAHSSRPCRTLALLTDLGAP